MPSANHGIERFVERQMRNWELSRQQTSPSADTKASGAVHVCFAVSRELGSDGEKVAECLARCTGWPKYDREILDYMAGQEQVNRRMYEMLDERQRTWLHQLLEPFEPLGVDAMVTREQYFCRLVRAVLAIAQHEHAIFVGRGANFMLPPASVLAVRVVAPLKYRLPRVMQAEALDERAARRRIQHVEFQRAEFVVTHFGRRPYDPRRYDLVLNAASLSIEDMCALARHAMTRKTGLETPCCPRSAEG